MTEAERRAELAAIFAQRAVPSAEGIFDIGSLTAAERRRLAWGVQRGLVEKAQRPWPWLTVGTCIKTHYRLID